jgi:hypothetical protein
MTTKNEETGESVASRVNAANRAAVVEKFTAVTTTHNNVGYSNNVEIIETALRERFGLNDNSYVLKAVAAHIWSSVCVTTCDENGQSTWSQLDVEKAISSCMYRLNAMQAKLPMRH